MIYLFVFVVVITILYSLLVVSYVKGWKSIRSKGSLKAYNQKITVVVACKNEAHHLPKLLNCLSCQTVSGFELVLVDDQSTDQTLQFMHQCAIPNTVVIQSDGVGKKRALLAGVKMATSDFVVTTDADCIMNKNWLLSLLNARNETGAACLLGPVVYENSDTFFGKWQQLEFHSLVSSSAAACGLQKAFMCNGANFAFERKTWLDNYAQINEHINSGDDVFMLHAFKRNGQKISFVKATDALVYTKPAHNLRAFFRQRIRWTSKTGSYTDLYAIYVAVLVLLVSICQILTLALSFFTLSALCLYVFVTVFKALVDIVFLDKTASFFGLKISPLLFLFTSFVYPFYILLTVVLAFLSVFKAKTKTSSVCT